MRLAAMTTTRRSSARALLLQLMAALLAATPRRSAALDNGLALTPPMGWLAWERFTCQIDCDNYPHDCISSGLFKRMADLLVEGGYAAAGYEYVNIDDCWSELERDAQTERLRANGSRFPEGIGQLASYVHARGLKLGIYGDCGAKTCAGYPAQLRPAPSYLDDPLSGSRAPNYFELDANTFADWTIDSFKFDGCFIEATEAESICPGMSLALAATKRPILLVCEWPFYMMYAHAEPNFTLAAESCNVWRYYDDIEGK